MNLRALFGSLFITLLGVQLSSCNSTARTKHDTPNLKVSKFSIYIDAGSSGARLGIYSVETNENGSVDIKEVADKSTTSGVGIHIFANKTDEISKYLDPLIEYAETFVGKDQISDTPIYVYGTGGLRSLSIEDQKHVLNEVESYLKNKKHFKTVQAKTVKGHEEGIFGWLTVNYLSGNFNSPDSKTVGVVDVGGATLQLAFEVGKLEGGHHEHILNFKIANKRHYVYVYSYPRFGQNVLLKDNETIQKACLEKSYPHSELKNRFAKCNAQVASILKETCADLSHCGLSNIYQPKLEGKFIGIGGMVYLTRELGVESLNWNYLLGKASETCNLSDEQVKLKYRSGFVDDASAMCFRIVFLKSMLFGEQDGVYNGFGFSKEDEIQVPREINGHKSFSWMIGAVYFNSVIKTFRKPGNLDL